MDITNYDTYDESFETGEVYFNELNQLNSGVNILLSEFKNAYVAAKMNPTNSEYQQQFENVKSSLGEIMSKSFAISNDVQTDTNDLNKALVKLNILINEEREKNKQLKKQLGIVDDQYNAANEMISDYKQMYDKNYLRNWGLLLSCLLAIFTIGKIYK